MRFSEFHVGQTIEAGPYLVDEGEILRHQRGHCRLEPSAISLFALQTRS